MLRLWPYLLAALLGIGVLGAVVFSPKHGDEKVWETGRADITVGSGGVVNSFHPASSADNKPAAPSTDPSLQPATEAAPTTASNQPFLPQPGDKGLNPPSKDLLEDVTVDGAPAAVPRNAADGRMSWHYYARPFDGNDQRPRLAIIMRDMGLSAVETRAAIADTPPEVTFAFSPYGDETTALMNEARAGGHEALLQLPLETAPAMNTDVGPRSLSSKNPADKNNDNLLWNLSRAQGYAGVMSDGGGRLITNNDLLQPLMQNIMSRGLLFIDDTRQAQSSSPLLAEQLQAPWGRTVIQLDALLTADAIDVAFGKALALARSDGRVIAVVNNTPMVRAALNNWARRLGRENIALAPVSAVVTVGATNTAAAPPPANVPPPLSPDKEPAAADEAGGDAPPSANAAPAANDDLSSVAPQPGAIQPDGSVNLLSDKKASGATVPQNLLDPSKAPAAQGASAPAPAAAAPAKH